MAQATANVETDQRRGVLVVDDDAAIREMLCKRLCDLGFRVWVAANGKEVLDHFSDHVDEIAVILLDVQIPGLDGPQTLDAIRQMSTDTPICFMSGDSGKYRRADLLSLGARHLFDKPFRLDELCHVVHELANESTQQRQPQ